MRSAAGWKGVHLHTIGHSTRSLDELCALLRAFEVTTLVDIRTIPRSRHNPQFDAATLPRALRARGIGYAHLAALGGLRHARRDSPNAGWRNASFRGYADYMATPGFEAGLGELRALAGRGAVALMCAEAVPWRCHRSLVADALTARGARVEHITGPRRASSHRLTPFAEVEGDAVSYPPDQRLVTGAPFHLEATVRVLQRRPANLVDVWAGDRYRRALPTEAGLALVEVTNRGTVDAPDVRLGVVAGELPGRARAEAVETIRRVLGLDVEPAPLGRALAAAPALRAVARGLRGLRPPRFASLFEAFASVIPFQQVSLDSGVAVLSRLVQRLGAPLEHEGGRAHAFPTAAAVAGARLPTLRAAGLSAKKAEALRGVARAVEDGEVTVEGLSAMSSADAVLRLSELPGIGAWSASVVLLRGLGRLDVFPPGDAGVARGLERLLGISSPRALARLVEGMGDRRGYLYFCALGGALLGKGLIHAAPSR
jgi:3-methyladenine DNA glycosylase/8-oxoguanine DNA glycosylase